VEATLCNEEPVTELEGVAVRHRPQGGIRTLGADIIGGGDVAPIPTLFCNREVAARPKEALISVRGDVAGVACGDLPGEPIGEEAAVDPQPVALAIELGIALPPEAVVDATSILLGDAARSLIPLRWSCGERCPCESDPSCCPRLWH